MKPILRNYRDENDFWRIRNFLREVFLLNNRLEHSWHVARWDYLHFHFVKTCGFCTPLEKTISVWETPDGQIAAVLNSLTPDEAFLHIHPAFRAPELEQEMIRHAEQTFSNTLPDGKHRLYLPVDGDDHLRKDVLSRLGYAGIGALGYEHYRDLEGPLPDVPLPEGYAIRSMGNVDEHPARSWASWLAFHSNEPRENDDWDWSWYQNLQSAPLYRRDLDIVAATVDGQIACFCTIYYDDATRAAVVVLDGTAASYWRRGLGKAALAEGMRRLQGLGCTRVFAKAYDTIADAFYSSLMPVRIISETWIKDYEL